MAQDCKMAFLTGNMVKTVEEVVVVTLSLQAFYEVFVFTIRVFFPRAFFFLPLAAYSLNYTSVHKPKITHC